MSTRSIRIALATLAAMFALGFAAGARAQTTCTGSDGAAPVPTTATLSILSPASGSTLTTPGCALSGEILGRWTITGPQMDHDFYIVIDRSGSTTGDSGADVNGNGILREAADNILRAELAAATAFVEAVPPDHGRVAIITFGSSAVLQQPLGSVADALAALARLSTLTSSGGTSYTSAMTMVETEVGLRGNPATRQQRCLFLSDGRPGESLSTTDAAARRLAALGVLMDTFALGFDTSAALENMATITGGTFTPLDVPGDIVAVLPWFVPVTPSTFVALHLETGQVVPIDVRDDGTFSIDVALQLGLNRIRLTLSVGDPPTVTVTCGIDVTLVQSLTADAGPDLVGCAGRPLTLTGMRSFVPCSSPRHRWLDCRGNPVCPPSADPTCLVTCGSCDRYVLETWCAGEGCPRSDEVLVSCTRVPPPLPVQVRTCGLDVFVSCGPEPPGYESGWDLDQRVDTDRNGDPRDDADLIGCDQSLTLPAPGSASVSAWRRDPAACSIAAPLVISAATELPRPLDGGACPGEALRLSCGLEPPGGRTEWDLDASTDSDGDGDRGNDADLIGCDVTTWPADGPHAIRGWSIDAWGCRTLAASGTILVDGSIPPAEAWGLRLSKSAPDLDLRWQPVAAADRYRISRGTLWSLSFERAYDHVVDEPAGSGACAVSGETGTLAGEIAGPDDFYYLVTSVSDCAGEGPTGFAWTRRVQPRRPPRAPSASCP